MLKLNCMAMVWFSSADSNDFVPLSNETFVIPSSTSADQIMCFQLEVIGDDICEENEMYFVTVTPSDPLDTITGTNIATVTIVNDADSKSILAQCVSNCVKYKTSLKFSFKL